MFTLAIGGMLWLPLSPCLICFVVEEKNGEEENEIRKRMGKRKNKGERKELGLR